MDVFRDFNIISNKYWEGHEQKENQAMEQTKAQIEEKYKKTHDFNYITCSFYDKEKEERALEDRKIKQKEHGKEYLNRLPPTLRVRETVVFDSSKDVPEEVKRFDEKKKNQKRRYEKRHQLEEEYRDINIANQDKIEELALNKYRNDKYFLEKLKGYDNITLEGTKDLVKTLEIHGKTKPKPGLWDQIQHSAIEKLPDRPGTLKDVAVENVAIQQVDVDQIPLYKREPEDHHSPGEPLTAHYGETASVHHGLQNSVHQERERLEELVPVHESYHGSNHHEIGGTSQHGQQAGPARSTAPPKLHNAELQKHTALYRAGDAPQPAYQGGGGSLSNGPAPLSRTHSSLSRSSKLSFSSGKSRMSNTALKLPSLKAHGDQGYHEPHAPVQKPQAVKIKSMGIESGGFQ